MPLGKYSQFRPSAGTNQIVDTTSGPISVSVDANARTLRVVNVGTNLAHVRYGVGAQSVTTADTPLQGGDKLILNKQWGEDTVACRHAVLPTVLHIQTGDGE